MLAQVADPDGRPQPALVAQQFGKGHVAALMLGDLWHWGMRARPRRRATWRSPGAQTVRWLVGDVPGRVDVDVRPKAGRGRQASR
ncbi:MAG: hypothetical protein U0835_16925 [Isosphaeraceae bacterium]